MYRKKQSFEKYINGDLDNSIFIVEMCENTYLIYSENNIIKFKSNTPPLNIKKVESKIYLNFSDGKFGSIDETGFIRYKNYSVLPSIEINKKFLFYDYDKENFNLNYNLIDINDNKFYFEKHTQVEIFQFDNYFIGHDENTIFNYNSVSNIWQQELSYLGQHPFKDQPDEIESLLGIAHGHLWVSTHGARLLTIDVQTGTLVNKFSNNEEDEKEGYKIIPLGHINFNENDKNIYTLSVEYILKINTQTQEIEYKIHHKAPSHPMANYNILNCLLQENYLTFIAKPHKESRCRFIGLFDIIQKELVWMEEVIKEIPTHRFGRYLIPSQPVRLSDNRLYVKDSEDTLYIYERTEES